MADIAGFAPGLSPKKRASGRLPSFDFEKMALVGKDLRFGPGLDGNVVIVCTPISARKVLFRGREMSQLEAARRAAADMGLAVTKDGVPRRCHPGAYWIADDGRSLGEIWGDYWRDVLGR